MIFTTTNIGKNFFRENVPLIRKIVVNDRFAPFIVFLSRFIGIPISLACEWYNFGKLLMKITIRLSALI